MATTWPTGSFLIYARIFSIAETRAKKKNKTRSNAVGQNPTSHRQKDVDDERTPNLT